MNESIQNTNLLKLIPITDTAPVIESKNIPFILWTLPGSGGRRVMEALASLFPQMSLQINPFGVNGLASEIVSMFDKPRKDLAKKSALRNFLEKKCLVMHEISDQENITFNTALIEIATRIGYRHILLYRRDNLHRLLLEHHESSLQNFANNNDNVELMPLDSDVLRKKNTNVITSLLMISYLLPTEKRLTIALEDMIKGGIDRSNGIQLMNFLGLDNIPVERRLEVLMRIADDSSEPRLSHLVCYPGFSEFQRDVRLMPGFEEGCAIVRPVVENLAMMKGKALFYPDNIPPIMREGSILKFAGIAFPPKKFNTDSNTKIHATQGKINIESAWGLPSPLGKRLFKLLPQSVSSRYAPLKIKAKSNIPVMISLCNSQGQKAELARIRFENSGRKTVNGIFIRGVSRLGEWSIGYLPIPKIASTSIYNGLYKLLTGQYYKGEGFGKSFQVHWYFQKKHADISGAKFRFVVVRDPIKRFLSAYTHRVLQGQKLSRAAIETLSVAQDLDLSNFLYNPSLSEFICHFEFYYQTIPDIGHHFRPQSEFIISLNQFEYIYPIEKLERLPIDVKKYCGVSLELPHQMKSGKGVSKLTVQDITDKEFEIVKNFYAGDYEMLADLYSPNF